MLYFYLVFTTMHCYFEDKFEDEIHVTFEFYSSKLFLYVKDLVVFIYPKDFRRNILTLLKIKVVCWHMVL